MMEILISAHRNLFKMPISFFNNCLCNYSKRTFKKKTAEQILGIDKPKKPIPPFFKFMSLMKRALLVKNPGLSVPEAYRWGGKHWRELDTEAKSKMIEEYEKEKDNYKTRLKQYEASLTEEQKSEIKDVRNKLKVEAKNKKIKEESKLLGRPKRPPSAYLLFIQVNKTRYKGKWGKELQEHAKLDWSSLSADKKSQYETDAKHALEKYKKNVEEWKQKVISIGRFDLVSKKQPKLKKSKIKPA